MLASKLAFSSLLVFLMSIRVLKLRLLGLIKLPTCVIEASTKVSIDLKCNNALVPSVTAFK